MKPKVTEGSWVALVTPFLDNGNIDFDSLKKLVNFHLKAKTDGILICGTTGESVTLNHDEKKSLMQAVRSQAGPDFPLMFGCGGNDTAAVVQAVKDSAEFGADALLVVTPYYNKPPQEGLKAHFRAVSAATELPIVLYNVPGRTGCNMLAETTLALAELPNVVAVKEASGNLDQCMEIIHRAPPGFILFSGEDALNLPIMACGARGTISVTANIAPAMMKKFNDAALSKNFDLARELHFKMLSAHRGLFIEANPLPAKAALQQKGLIKDNARLPLCKPSTNAHELMKKLIPDLE